MASLRGTQAGQCARVGVVQVVRTEQQSEEIGSEMTRYAPFSVKSGENSVVDEVSSPNPR